MATNNIRSTGSTVGAIYKTSSTSVPVEVEKMYITNSAGDPTLVYDTGTVTPPPATGRLTQATMPSLAEAWTLSAAPTITTSATQTVSGTLYTPATSGLFKPLGTTSISQIGTSGFWRGNFMADTADAGGANPNFLASYGVKFESSAATIEIRIRQRSDVGDADASKFYYKMPIRVKVNGQWTSEFPVYIGVGNTGYDSVSVPSNITAATGDLFVKLAFGSATDRTVEVWTMGEFGGIAAPAGSISAATAPLHTAVVLGDSLTGAEKHGTGNWSLSGTEGSAHHATYTQLSSLWGYVCQSLGYDNVVTSSAGSSGYRIIGDTVAYSSPSRMQNDVIAHDPELVMVGTSFNDIANGVSAADVKTYATTTISNIVANTDTGTVIVMLGNPKVPASLLGGVNPDLVVPPFNTALKEVAEEQGVWFFNPYDGKLYNKSGTLTYTDPNGGLLQNNSQYVSSDDTHPTQLGSQFFGKKISEFLRRAHPAS